MGRNLRHAAERAQEAAKRHEQARVAAAEYDRMGLANNVLVGVDFDLIEGFEPVTDEGRFLKDVLDKLVYAVRLIYVELADHQYHHESPPSAQANEVTPCRRSECVVPASHASGYCSHDCEDLDEESPPSTQEPT